MILKNHRQTPGQLTISGLQKMNTILEHHREGEANNMRVPAVAQAFYHQITFPEFGTGQDARKNLRNLRDAQTWSAVLDHLARQEVGAAGDIAIQRLKALEKAMSDGHWSQAQHLEILPPHTAGLLDRSEEQMVNREARLDQRFRQGNVNLQPKRGREDNHR